MLAPVIEVGPMFSQVLLWLVGFMLVFPVILAINDSRKDNWVITVFYVGVWLSLAVLIKTVREGFTTPPL
jgi:hypothetical protein